MSKPVVSIKFKVHMSGVDGVNFDKAESQIGAFCRLPHIRIDTKNSNNKLHKGNFYVDTSFDADGNKKETVSKKQKISAECLKQAVFANAQPVYLSSIVHNEHFNEIIASRSALLRGYMFALSSTMSIKRKSPVMMYAPEQVTDTTYALSTMQILTSRDVGKSKDENNEDVDKKSDLTMAFKESFGKIEYLSRGAIDINELRFLSMESRFLRPCCKVDDTSRAAYTAEIMKRYSGAEPVETGFFAKIGSDIPTAEEGLQLPDAAVVDLVRYFFQELLNTRIDRNSGYAEVVGVDICPVFEGDSVSHFEKTATYQPLEDPMTLSFVPARAYRKISDDECADIRRQNDLQDSAMLDREKKKKAEKAALAEKKAKKSAGSAK